MNFVIDNILLIYFLPLVLAVFCFALHFIKIGIPQKYFFLLIKLSAIVQLLFSIIVFFLCNFTMKDLPDVSAEWIRFADFAIFFGFYIDKISSIFLLFFSIFFVSLINYSCSDKQYSLPSFLFFACINMIDLCMIALILSSNIIQSFVCLILTGIFSYLLINADFAHYSFSKSSQNFILQNRLADTLVFLGMIILIYFVINYPISTGRELLAYSDFHEIAADFYIYLSDECFLLTCILFIAGFSLKISQFPFHYFFIKLLKISQVLTPLIVFVSVMTACVYFTVRLLPLFSLDKSVMHVLVSWGTLSALLCAAFASASNKPQKIITYSLISQTSASFVLLGYSASSEGCLFFFFSILALTILYLTAILYTKTTENTNIVYSLIPVKKHPMILLSALIAVFVQIALFFDIFLADSSGFLTVSGGKDSLYTAAFSLTALLSSFYLTNLLFLLFSKKEFIKDSFSPISSKILSVLCLTILFGVFCLLIFFSGYGSSVFNFKNLNSSLYLLLLSMSGIIFALLSFYKSNCISVKGINLANFLKNGLFIHKLFECLADNVVDFFANFTKNFDKYVINTFFNSLGYMTKFLSYCVTVFQNGNVQSYIAYGISIICVLIIIYIFIVFCIGGIF